MYMVDLNQWPIIWAIVAPIQIKHVYSSIPYDECMEWQVNYRYQKLCKFLIKIY